MKVDTPVATMGIRGTTPRVEISDDGTVKFSTLIEEGKDQVMQRAGAGRPAAGASTEHRRRTQAQSRHLSRLLTTLGQAVIGVVDANTATSRSIDHGDCEKKASRAVAHSKFAKLHMVSALRQSVSIIGGAVLILMLGLPASGILGGGRTDEIPNQTEEY